MSSVSSVVKRHPIVTFFVLSYAVAWMLVPFGSFGAYGAARRSPDRGAKDSGTSFPPDNIRFRSRDWFDDHHRIDQSALYLERFMNYGITQPPV
jgi:hypothetical protein